MTALPDPQLSISLRRAFTPPSPILPSLYAEQTIVLPASNNAMPGPLSLAKHQIEMVDSLVEDGIEIVAMQCAAQTGKTTVLEAMLASIIGNMPGPTLFVQPTGDKANEFVAQRLNPMIDNAPTLRALVGKGGLSRRGHSGGTDTNAMKSFPGGFLKMASSYRAEDLSASSCRYVLLDETDRFATTAGIDGNPIDLAIKRSAMFEGKGRRVVMASTPTGRFASRINAYYLRGDQRKLMCACVHCLTTFAMHHSDLKWPEEKTELAYHVCPGCGAVSDEAARLKMLQLAVWIPTATPVDPTIRSYHMPQLASQFASMAEVARQFAAAVTPAQKVTFYNLCAGECYDAGVDVEMSAIDFQARAIEIGEPYPADIQFVVAGTDVQSNRVETTFTGFGPRGKNGEEPQAWVLHHLVTYGDITGEQVWLDLDAALGQKFKTADGRELPVQISGIDGGFSVEIVTRFVEAQRAKRRRTFVTKGVDKWSAPWIREGSRVRTGQQLSNVRYQLIGTWEIKYVVAQRLAKQDIGSGFIHLPSHLDASYFEGLASEQLLSKTNKGGVPELRWTRIIRQNEPFDTLCICMALSTLARPHRPKAAAVTTTDAATTEAPITVTATPATAPPPPKLSPRDAQLAKMRALNASLNPAKEPEYGF